MMKLTPKLSCSAAKAADSQASPTSSNNDRRAQFGSLDSVGGTAGSRPDVQLPYYMVAPSGNGSHSGCHQSIAASTLTGPAEMQTQTSTLNVNGDNIQSPGYADKPRRTLTDNLHGEDDCDSAMLWSDDPEKEYFQYILRQEQEVRAQQGKSAELSLVGDSTIGEIQNQQQQQLEEPSVLFEGYSLASTELSSKKPKNVHHPTVVTPLRTVVVPPVVDTDTTPNIVLPNNIVFLPHAPSTIDSWEQREGAPQKEGDMLATRAKSPYFYIILAFLLVCLMLACVTIGIFIAAMHRQSNLDSNINTGTTSGDAILGGLPTTSSNNNIPTASPSRLARGPTGVENDDASTSPPSVFFPPTVSESVPTPTTDTVLPSPTPSLRPSRDAGPPTTAPSDNSIATPTDRPAGETYCGCRDCTPSELTASVTIDCVARINYLMTAIDWSEEQACRQIAGKEYPEECSQSKCNPDLCEREETVEELPGVYTNTPYPTSASDLVDPTPTQKRTVHPTTATPTAQMPTRAPTNNPTVIPNTAQPTRIPTTRPPTRAPTESPVTARPTEQPTRRPTHAPTASSVTEQPTRRPSRSYHHAPSESPSVHPVTPRPTQEPTWRPTKEPTWRPTPRPTWRPTQEPTWRPTHRPTWRPTQHPTWRPTQHPTWRQVSVSNLPANRLDLRLAFEFPLRRCEGDCDTDNDCQQGLVCLQREAGDPIPGCIVGGNEDALEETITDFCVPTPRPASAANQLDLRFGLYFPLNRCEGDCDTDYDCQQGLYCFQRERGGPVPGCLLGGNPDALEETRTDFCVPEDNLWDNP